MARPGAVHNVCDSHLEFPVYLARSQEQCRKPFIAGLALVVAAVCAGAQETKVAIGWTGFAPLTLAKEAEIFKKNGLDVSLKKIPRKDRHLAIATGDVQCAATTVET